MILHREVAPKIQYIVTMDVRDEIFEATSRRAAPRMQSTKRSVAIRFGTHDHIEKEVTVLTQWDTRHRKLSLSFWGGVGERHPG